MPAQPAVCLLRLLCACSAFFVPQYSRAYYVPAQPSMCHNTADPTVYLLSLLCATIQLSLLCACSGCCVPAQAAVCLLRLLYAYSGCCMPAQPAAPPSQYTEVYCDTKPCLLLILVTIHSVYYDPTPQPSQASTCHDTVQCVAIHSYLKSPLVTIHPIVLRYNAHQPSQPPLLLSQYT